MNDDSSNFRNYRVLGGVDHLAVNPPCLKPQQSRATTGLSDRRFTQDQLSEIFLIGLRHVTHASTRGGSGMNLAGGSTGDYASFSG